MYVSWRKTSCRAYPDTGGSGVLPLKIFILKIVCGAFWRISEHFLSTKQILQTNNIYIPIYSNVSDSLSPGNGFELERR